MIPGSERIGHSDNIEQRIIVGEVSIGIQNHILGTGLNGLQHLGAGTELLGGEDIDDELSIGLLFNNLLEGFSEDLIMVIGVVGVAQAQLNGLNIVATIVVVAVAIAAGNQGQDHSQCHNQCDDTSFHDFLPFFFVRIFISCDLSHMT